MARGGGGRTANKTLPPPRDGMRGHGDAAYPPSTVLPPKRLTQLFVGVVARVEDDGVLARAKTRTDGDAPPELPSPIERDTTITNTLSRGDAAWLERARQGVDGVRRWYVHVHREKCREQREALRRLAGELQSRREHILLAVVR